MSYILDVMDATVQFGGVTAVDSACLRIQKGQLIGFVGPNGAGKTTLMRVITGIIKPQQGRVLLNGQDLAGMSIHQRINAGLALAQQIVQPLRGMSLIDNIILALGSQKTRNPFKAMTLFDRDTERQKAVEILTKVGLQDVVDADPNELPLGYLKRLELARAVALDPSLLLLDEPLAGLNQSEASALANLIRNLNQNGLTILLIEHNLKEVMRICPDIYVQDNGRSLAFGPAQEVMSRPEVIKAYLGDRDDA